MRSAIYVADMTSDSYTNQIMECLQRGVIGVLMCPNRVCYGNQTIWQHLLNPDSIGYWSP